MAYTQDLKSCDFTVVRVRLPPAAPVRLASLAQGKPLNNNCPLSSAVEQLFCKQQVVSSNLTVGSKI